MYQVRFGWSRRGVYELKQPRESFTSEYYEFGTNWFEAHT